MSRRYDSRTTTFTPDGRLQQIEYAVEAINKTGSAIGTNRLTQESSPRKAWSWPPKNMRPHSCLNRAKSPKRYTPSTSISTVWCLVCQLMLTTWSICSDNTPRYFFLWFRTTGSSIDQAFLLKRSWFISAISNSTTLKSEDPVLSELPSSSPATTNMANSSSTLPTHQATTLAGKPLPLAPTTSPPTPSWNKNTKMISLWKKVWDSPSRP